MSLASGSIARSLSTIFGGSARCGLRDDQLLERFRTQRDEAAFAILVSRHGPMVRGVCRALRLSSHDVDDAFQATFLVLARRSGDVRDPQRLGPWLYGVAYRVAQKARATQARHRSREIAFGTLPNPEPADPASRSVPDDSPLPLIHEELARLPARYREPIVLCLLDGRSHVEAAAHLQCPVGTVKGRLSRARALLKQRLLRRGLTLSAATIAGILSTSTHGEISPHAADALAASAVSFARGGPVATALSTAAQLAQKVVSTMTLTPWKWAATGLLALGLATAESGTTPQAVPLALASVGLSQDPNTPKQANTPGEGSSSATPSAETGNGAPGDPQVNPADVTPDLDDLLKQRVKAAREYLELAQGFHDSGTITIDRLVAASRRLLAAELDASTSSEERLAARRRHDKLAQEILNREKAGLDVGTRRLVDVAEANLNQIESQIDMARDITGIKADVALEPAGLVAGRSENVPGEAKNVDEPAAEGQELADRVMNQLERPIALPFESETPLSDVVQYLKSATQSPELPAGIPIYVDPIGLKEANVTNETPIIIELNGIPLKRGLFLALRSIGLAYTVQDGLLIISTQDQLKQLLETEPMVGP